MSNISIFCRMVRKRSVENNTAFQLLINQNVDVYSPLVSLLRQELDSMIRVIFLLNIKNLQEIERLVALTINGEMWHTINSGKKTIITDKAMVDIANDLQGWTKYVYKFGCAFIHLSSYHNRFSVEPLTQLDDQDLNAIKKYIEQYHGQCESATVSIQDILHYLPNIFNKITSNLECHVSDLGALENGNTITF